MDKENKKINMKELFIENSDALGYWQEEHKQMILTRLLCDYNKEIIKEWTITDILINGSKIILKWKKRIMPLSDKDVKEEFGID